MEDPSQRRVSIVKGTRTLAVQIRKLRTDLRRAPRWFDPKLDPARLNRQQMVLFRKWKAVWDRLQFSQQLTERLRSELSALDAGRFDPRRCMVEMLRWLNRARTARDVLRSYRIDPLSELDGPRVNMGLRLANQLLKARDRIQGRRPGQFRRPNDIRRLPFLDDVVYWDLWYTGCWRWRPQPPREAVGVMLPVRLETRFYAPDLDQPTHRLRLRIVPDNASIVRHDPKPTDVELDDLDKLWQRGTEDLNSPEFRAAWQWFVEQHGGPRATWLARTFRPLAGNDTIDRPADTRREDEPVTSQVAGFPSRLEVWMARAGGSAQRVKVLSVRRNMLRFELVEPEKKAWWNSYSEAIKIGLATEIDLGGTPDDIDTLYVVGISNESPGELFVAHRDAGQMAIIEPGTPTNSADGEPAVDLGGDADYWREVLVGAGSASATERLLGQSLTADVGALSPMPGTDEDLAIGNESMVTALWPALWGHALRDIWGFDDRVDDLGLWAADNLRPEGPLPAVRIGDQPYGLLPTTDLAAWVASTGDPAPESLIRESLLELQDLWATTAESAGNATGADTDRLLQIVGQTASSEGYAYRYFVSLETLLLLLMILTPSPEILTALLDWWNATSDRVLSFPVQPNRRFASIGFPHDLELPLVEPTWLPADMDLPGFLRWLAKATPHELIGPDRRSGVLRDGKLPDSLLIRLLIHALVMTAADVARQRKKDPRPLLDPYVVDAKDSGLISFYARRFTPTHLGVADSATKMFRSVRAAIETLATRTVRELERVLRVTLDTATHRIDPWVTAFSTRRLADFSNTKPRLGVYGWVDAPRPGTAGAIPETMLLAPSDSQVTTSLILRDKAMRDPQPERWAIDLQSDTVRHADRLATKIRLGEHPDLALGRAVENVVADPAVQDELRRTFPVRIEHDGRRTCNGRAVLHALKQDPGSLPAGLTAAERAELAVLDKAIDTYSDLLVVQSAHDVVSGRETASAAMDAAAGFARPPILESLRTTRGGRDVNTNLLVAIPGGVPIAAANITHASSPGRIADPAVAALLITEIGSANSEAWEWQTTTDAGVDQAVRLSDLQLEPIDALLLSPANLAGIVEEHVGAGSSVDESISTGLNSYREAQRIVGLLGRRPAALTDLSKDGRADDGSALDESPIGDDLVLRIEALRTAATLLQVQLENALGANDATRRVALTNAMRWGITPLKSHSDPLTDEELDQMVERARDSIAQRLGKAPAAVDVAGLSNAEVSRAISALATPEGQIPILARLRIDQLPQQPDLEDRRAVTGLNELDASWLEVVAAVRDHPALLNAHQSLYLVAGKQPWAAWTNRKGDPWQQAVDPDSNRSSRLISIYGPDGVLAADPATVVAVGMLDSWGEVVPDVEHTASVAFGFQAPASRAPQAILLAVPPRANVALSTEDIVGILAQTRRLARARVARPEDLYSMAAGVPLVMLPATGPAAVDLTP